MRINSRSVDDLRPDVAANVRIFIVKMKEQGYPVGISSTLRNDEQQAYLYAQGRTRRGSVVTYSKVTTFHGGGLAFDIFQNIKGKEWNDSGFWTAAREILSAMGFSFLSFEKAHSQWSAYGEYSGSRVRARDLPPNMPLYGEEDDMDGKEIYEKLNEYTKALPCPDWAKAELQEAIDAGITDGTDTCVLIPRYQAAIMAKRAIKK